MFKEEHLANYHHQKHHHSHHHYHHHPFNGKYLDSTYYVSNQLTIINIHTPQ